MRLMKPEVVIQIPAVGLPPEEAAHYLGIGPDKLKEYRLRGGGGPRYVPLGPRTVVYRVRDLDEWIERQPSYRNTSEEPSRVK